MKIVGVYMTGLASSVGDLAVMAGAVLVVLVVAAVVVVTAVVRALW